MSDLISRQAAIDALGERPTVWTDDDDYALGERNQYDMDRLAIETVPSAQLAQDLTNGCTDTISRAAVVDAIEGVDWYHQNKNGEMVHGANSDNHQAWYKAEDIYTAIGSVPSAQLAQDLPKGCTDTISRQAAIRWVKTECNPYGNPTLDFESSKKVIEHLEQMPPAQPGEDIRAMCGECDAWNQYKNYPQPQWIPCSERLPEEDTEVLISYRYKEGEGDTDHVNIDITSYGTTCFGGREIHTLKEWRQPFDYFHANYEVIAWMPLPTPYREGGQDGKN